MREKTEVISMTLLMPRSAGASSSDCLACSFLHPARRAALPATLATWGAPGPVPPGQLICICSTPESTAQLTVTSLHKPSNPVRPEASQNLPGQKLHHPPIHPSIHHPAWSSIGTSRKRACHSPAFDKIACNTAVQQQSHQLPTVQVRNKPTADRTSP